MSLRLDNKKINNILVTSQGYKFSTVKWINTGYLASGTWDSEKTEIAIWRKDVSIKKSPPYLSIYAKGNLDSEIFQVDATETLSVSACSDGYLRFHKTVVKADVASALITSQPANFKHELGCTCAKISQHLSISGGGDGYVCAYDSELHKLVWSNKENSQSEEIRDLCFINQNGFDFASTSSSVEIRLFDVRTNKTALLLFPLGFANVANCIAVNAYNKNVISVGTENGNLIVIDVRNFKRPIFSVQSSGSVSALLFDGVDTKLFYATGNNVHHLTYSHSSGAQTNLLYKSVLPINSLDLLNSELVLATDSQLVILEVSDVYNNLI